jgi:hypothetical protein
MHSSTNPDIRISRLMARSHGVASRAEAKAAGLSDEQIEYRLATGRWTRPTPGVYVMAGSRDTWQQRAAVAVKAGPPGTVASHHTALALRGLCRAPTLPHVTVPRGTSGRKRVARVHYAPIPMADRATADDIPTTSVARALLDCAAIVGRSMLCDLVDAAIIDGYASPDALLRTAARAGRKRGKALLADVLAAWGAIEPESMAEVRLLRRLDEWGFDPPATQFEVTLPDGRVVRLDAAWADRLVAIEYDSPLHHGPRRWERDEACRGARALGWTVLTADKLSLLPGERDLRDTLEAAFARTRRDHPSPVRAIAAWRGGEGRPPGQGAEAAAARRSA